MRGVFLILVICLCPMGGAAGARADIAVIAHPELSVESLSRQEVSDLFLGRARALNTGSGTVAVTLFEPPSESEVRQAFFSYVNNMSLRQVNAYWARLRFSGRVLPPVSLRNTSLVLQAVQQTPGAIGYVPVDEVDGRVRVILVLGNGR